MAANALYNKRGTIQMSFTFLVMIILGGLMLTVGVKYISKMAFSIDSFSDDIYKDMRNNILRQIRTKNPVKDNLFFKYFLFIILIIDILY